MAEVRRVGGVGPGYVGLVKGACLPHLGHRVTNVDKDDGRIRGLEGGQMPFYEPRLGELLAKSAGGRVRFGTKPDGMVHEAGAIFVCVATPQGEGGSAFPSSVAAVAGSIGRTLAQGEGANRERPLLVVNKSTVPVGSGDHRSCRSASR